MKSHISKENIRDNLSSNIIPAQATHGKIAELLRNTDLYRNSNRVYCGPSFFLKQIRVNTLLDGQELVMPGPGMKEGFYKIKPFAIPFKKMSFAVTYKGLGIHGKRLDNSDLKKLGIDLMIDHVEAASRSGYFLGDGKGFFDLATAILSDTGGLARGFNVITVIEDMKKIVDDLPNDPWDIQANAILHPDGFDVVSEKVKRPEILWEFLEMDRIKRVTPLWKHYVATREKK